MPGLLTSPPELLLSILARCDVFSVYALRRTCKPLYDLTHERVVWIAQLIRAYEEVDAPLAQFNLDAMSASDIEARVTSRFRLTRTIRTSSRNARMNAPLSHRIIKSPPGTTWRAISSCPGGQWMAAVVGRELQIWDTSFVGGSPAPLASLEVKNLFLHSTGVSRSRLFQDLGSLDAARLQVSQAAYIWLSQSKTNEPSL
ncbi:hypothetical protein DL96DRAFT_524181 [Flagelloscypha sp. PMI_526]|nr:hypothetical protein DL96DRAFT_524181 [Flagelloscypha sp. PMI_526]